LTILSTTTIALASEKTIVMLTQLQAVPITLSMPHGSPVYFIFSWEIKQAIPATSFFHSIIHLLKLQPARYNEIESYAILHRSNKLINKLQVTQKRLQ
jgi:hypothetical protein